MLLAVGAVAGLAATWVAQSGHASVELVEAAPARPASAVRTDEAIRLEDLVRRQGDTRIRDAFAARSWQARVAPPSFEPAPAPAPVAPDQPFAYIGKMVYEGRMAVFIASGDRNYIVREGDVVQNTYRIDAIRAPLLDWTYLPLDTRHTMHIGDEN